MGSEARLDGNDGQVGIFEPPAVGGEGSPHYLEQIDAVRTAPSLVAGRKPVADVAAAGRAKQGVDQRVGERVAVRVAGQPAVVGDVDAAKPQWKAILERVDVQPVPDADHACRSARANAKSTGVVILKARSSPSKVATAMPSCSTRVASSVTSSSWSASARASMSRRKICGVWTTTCSTRGGVSMTSPSPTRLIVSFSGRTGIAAPVRRAAARPRV